MIDGANDRAIEFRFAVSQDIGLLADWNHQLIRDEDHRNPMTVSQLGERMRGWLDGDHRVVLFMVGGEPVAYAVYRESSDEVYLRQFFVRRDRRRQGIGRQAIGLLHELWPRHKRWTVEALCGNAAGVAFWRSVGYHDYCLVLEQGPAMSADTG